jgi:hypothetical protein
VIRVERDPAFWEAVAAHPAVAATLGHVQPGQVGAMATASHVLPLASEHGGFMFIRLDGLGFVCELHTLFTPEGWGREALLAAVEAVGAIWLLDYQAIVTCEMAGNERSRPPASFGFKQAGDWRETPLGTLRLWVLTRAAWSQSAAAKRRRAKCH